MGQGAGETTATMQASTNQTIASFKDLRVWQEGIELVREVYALCAKLPRVEAYAMATQIKRAAISIPSNIAEGHARNHRAEYRQFVFVAIGSLAELETQLHIVRELELLNSKEMGGVSERMGRLRGMLVTLGRRLA